MRVFVYGTLRDRTQLAYVLGHGWNWRAVADRIVGPADLEGWRRVDTRHGYPTIDPAPGERVDGILLEVSPVDALALDRYEGRGYLYDLVEVFVEGAPAFAYRMKENVR